VVLNQSGRSGWWGLIRPGRLRRGRGRLRFKCDRLLGWRTRAWSTWMKGGTVHKGGLWRWRRVRQNRDRRIWWNDPILANSNVVGLLCQQRSGANPCQYSMTFWANSYWPRNTEKTAGRVKRTTYRYRGPKELSMSK
jgi:hypothetical protein